jgi:hypothetical protein
VKKNGIKIMSLIGEINSFFNKYGESFDLQTINYTKQVVHKIKTSTTLKNFLTENDISASMLLNEITPYSQFKLRQYGDEKLDMKEIQGILNVILFSNEIENLMMNGDHVKFSSIGEAGELYYVADYYAVEYFNNKYGIELVEGEEFDFTILEDNGGGEDYLDFGYGGNSLS